MNPARAVLTLLQSSQEPFLFYSEGAKSTLILKENAEKACFWRLDREALYFPLTH